MNTQETIQQKSNWQEIELAVEEIETIIAPGLAHAWNHNESVEVDLSVEEAELVIAPSFRLAVNHNETWLG